MIEGPSALLITVRVTWCVSLTAFGLPGQNANQKCNDECYADLCGKYLIDR